MLAPRRSCPSRRCSIVAADELAGVSHADEKREAPGVGGLRHHLPRAPPAVRRAGAPEHNVAWAGSQVHPAQIVLPEDVVLGLLETEKSVVLGWSALEEVVNEVGACGGEGGKRLR